MVFPELLSISNSAVIFCATVFVQTTVIIGAGFCFAYTLRRRGAAIQSFILRAFLAAVFLCPLIALFFPAAGFQGITFELPQAVYHSQTSTLPSEINVSGAPNGKIQPLTNSPHSPVSYRALPHQETEQQNPQPVPNPAASVHVPTQGRSEAVPNSTGSSEKIKNRKAFPASDNIRADIYILVTVLWAAVSLFFLIRIGAYSAYIQYIRLTAFPAKPVFQEECSSLAKKLGMKIPEVLQHPSVQSPFLTGLFRPAILLPMGEKEKSLAYREIFLHELSHLKRYDHYWNLLRYIGVALLPFQPLLWTLSRRIEETSDYVCDDHVLNLSADHHSYAFSLLHLAWSYQPTRRETTAGVGLLSFKSPLKQRINRIFDDSRSFYLKVKMRSVVYVSSVCICITFLAGLIGVKGKSFARTNSVAEILSKTGSIVQLALAAAIVPPPSGKSGEESQIEGVTTKETQSVKAFPPLPEPSLTDETAPVQSESLLADDFVQPASATKETSDGVPNPAQSLIQSADTQSVAPAPKTTDAGKTVSTPQDKPELKQVSTAHIGSSLSPYASFVRPTVNVGHVPTGELNIQDPNSEKNLDAALLNFFNLGKKSPVWSPDGNTIAFTGQSGWGIWAVYSKGGHPSLVYNNSGEWEYNGRKFGGGLMKTLCFTPDGQEITFVNLIFDVIRGSRVESDTPGSSSYLTFGLIPVIESANIITGNVRFIAECAVDGSWSPDGRYFVFWECFDIDDQNNGSIIVYDTKTRERRLLAENGASPSVTPDGRFVIYTDGSKLYRVPFSGGKPELLPADGNMWKPKCSPDGRWILCLGSSGNDNGKGICLRAYDLLTGKTGDIVSSATQNVEMGTWSPNGRQFCYSVTDIKETSTGKSSQGASIHIADFKMEGISYTGIQQSTPLQFALIGNYPNPFNPSTTIEFIIPRVGSASLVIYNTAGQKVRELVSGTQTAGKHSVVWNGRDENGKPVSSGVYIAQLKNEGKVESLRMMLVK